MMATLTARRTPQLGALVARSQCSHYPRCDPAAKAPDAQVPLQLDPPASKDARELVDRRQKDAPGVACRGGAGAPTEQAEVAI